MTIVGPSRRADLALPVDIPLPHVLPGLLRALGEAGGSAAAAPGWVLQRLGGAPLDGGLSLAALGVLDGEILYLRPRESVLPPALFDDVADVVATGVREGSGKWEGRHTRLLGTGAAAGLLVVGALALALAGGPVLTSAIVAAVLAMLLLVAGASLSRAVGDSPAGAVIGYAALPYGFVAGLFAPSTGGAATFAAPNLLGALACTALVATIGGAVIADGVSGFLGTAIASIAGAVGAAVVMVFGLPAAGVAAITGALLLAFSPLVPTLSFRLARVPLPPLPTNADELRNDNQQVDSASLLERTVHAQRYATGLVTAIALTGLVAELFLVAAGGWLATSLAVTMAFALVMRARVFHGLGQRLWLIVPSLVALAVLAVSTSLGATGVTVVAVVIGLLWVAMILLGLGLWLPTGRPSPFWGRAGDIVEVMLIVALFPLALGVLEVYTWIRGLSG